MNGSSEPTLCINSRAPEPLFRQPLLSQAKQQVNDLRRILFRTNKCKSMNIDWRDLHSVRRGVGRASTLSRRGAQRNTAAFGSETAIHRSYHPSPSPPPNNLSISIMMKKQQVYQMNSAPERGIDTAMEQLPVR